LELVAEDRKRTTLASWWGDPLGTTTHWSRVFSGLMLVTSNPASRSSESSLLL